MVRFHFLIMSIVVLFLSILVLGSWNQVATAQLITNVTSYASPEYSAAASLTEGALSFGDRTFTWTSVPALVLNSEYVLTANDDKTAATDPLFSITISQDATIYVLMNDLVNPLPAWMGTFTDTNENVINSGPDKTYSIYSKDFTAGTINFGPQAFNDRMYGVVVKPQGPAPTPVPTETPGPPPTAAENWKLYR